MNRNPDIYLLYEYMEKLPFTVRMKAVLDSQIDETILSKAAAEAIRRFPYFSVKIGLDHQLCRPDKLGRYGQSY